MNRHDVALLLLTLALLPLLYVSAWFGIAVALASYMLVARLAGRDLDRSRYCAKAGCAISENPEDCD